MSTRFRLDGQVAAVTGACGKLGPVWVGALLEAGARVAALDLPAAPPSPAYRGTGQRSGRDAVLRVECDITQRASIEAAAQTVVEQARHPDVLVNNAGIDQPPDSPGGRHQLPDLPIDSFRRMVEVNLLGTFQVTQVFGALMAARPADRSSTSVRSTRRCRRIRTSTTIWPATRPFIKSPAYGASKAGVVSLSKFFATHWAGSGVRVNTLSPGGVLAGQDEQFKAKYGARVPMRRMAEAEDLKGPLIFLASGASSYVTGHELRVDGGFTAW